MASLLESRENASSTVNVIASPWTGCNMREHEITAIAHCCEYNITATGSSAGWIYLWKSEEDNASQSRFVPYVACVSQGGREFSVIQCYFVPWKHAFLVGMSIPVVLISHHANGLLKYWSIEDGRFLLVLSTTAFLGSPAIDSQLIANSQFLLLTTHWGLILLDLWRQCPCIVFSFGNPSCEGETGLYNILPIERMLMLRYFTNFHLWKSKNQNYNCMIPKEDIHAQNMTDTFFLSYDLFSKTQQYNFQAQSPIQDIATNNERVKSKNIFSNSASYTFVTVRLQNFSFYVWDITLALKKWKNSISMIQENDETNRNTKNDPFFSPHLMLAYPLQIVKIDFVHQKYLNPFCFKLNIYNQHIFQYPMCSSLSCSRLALDATCLAFCSPNGASIDIYKRTRGTNNVFNDVWAQRPCEHIEEENKDIIYDSNESRLQLLVPKASSKFLFNSNDSFLNDNNFTTSTWVGLHIITEATKELWASLISCDNFTLSKFTGHNVSLLCTLLIGYASDGRIFVYNLSMIFHSLCAGQGLPKHSYVNLLCIPHIQLKTSYFNPTQLYGKVFFEQLGTTAYAFACYVVIISGVSADVVNILHYYFNSHQNGKWFLCCRFESVSINGMWDRYNNISFPVALVTKPEPHLIHYKTSKMESHKKKPGLSLGLMQEDNTTCLPWHDSKHMDSSMITKNLLPMSSQTVDVMKTLDYVGSKKNKTNSLREVAQKPFQITFSTMFETCTKHKEMELMKQPIHKEKQATRLLCFLSFSDTFLIGGSSQGDILFWPLPALNKKFTLFSIHMSAVVLLMPLKVVCTERAENEFHPTFFCSIDTSSSIVLVEVNAKIMKHFITLTNSSNHTDQTYSLDHFLTSFEEYDLIQTDHDDLYNSPLVSSMSTPHKYYEEDSAADAFFEINKCTQEDTHKALKVQNEKLCGEVNLELSEGQAKVLRLRRYPTLVWQDIKDILLDSRYSIIFVKSATVGLFLFSSYSGAIITHIDLCYFTSKLVYAACVATFQERAQDCVKEDSTLLCPFSSQLTTCEETLKTFKSLWCQWFDLWRNLLCKSVLFQSFCEKELSQNVLKKESLLSKYILNGFLSIPQVWNGSYGLHEFKEPFSVSSITLLPMYKKSSVVYYDSSHNDDCWHSLRGVCRVPVISISLKECMKHHIGSPQMNCKEQNFKDISNSKTIIKEYFSLKEMFLCGFFLQQIPKSLFNAICMKLSKRQTSCLRELREGVSDTMWILGLGNSSSSFSWIFPKENVTAYFKNSNALTQSYHVKPLVLPCNKHFNFSNHGLIDRKYLHNTHIPLVVNDDCFILKKSCDNVENDIHSSRIGDMCHILFFENNRGIHLPVKVCKKVNEKDILEDFKTTELSRFVYCNLQSPIVFRSKSVPRNFFRHSFNFCKRSNTIDFQEIDTSWNVAKENEKLNRILMTMEGKKDFRNFCGTCDDVLSSYVTFVYSCMLHSIFMSLEKYQPTLWTSLNCYNTFCLTEKYQFGIVIEVFLNIMSLKHATSSMLTLWSYFMLSNTTYNALFCLCWKWCSSLCRLLNDKEWKECFNFSSNLLRHSHERECPKKSSWVLSMSYTMSRSDIMLCHSILFDTYSYKMFILPEKHSTKESLETLVQWSVLILFLFCFEKPQVFISTRLHHLNRYKPLGLFLLHYLLERVGEIAILSPIYGMWLLEMFRSTYPLLYRYMIKNDTRSNAILTSIEGQFHTSQVFNSKDMKNYDQWNIFQTEAYKELQMSLRCEESLLIPYHNLVLGFYSLCLNPFLKRHAFHTLLCLSLYDPLLFIKTFQYAMRRLDISTLFCHTGLLLLTHFFLKYPTLAIHYLTHILEVSIYCLDPAHPFLRRNSLELSTNLLCQLVHTFPMAVFHQATQRVAVGTSTGFIVIYDLRTTSKSYVVKAGSDPIDVVAFTKDGNQFASYNKTTQVFCLWQCSSSGFLAGVIRQTNDCQKFLKLPRLSEESLLETFHNQKGMELTFRDQHHWLLRREDGKTYVICV